METVKKVALVIVYIIVLALGIQTISGLFSYFFSKTQSKDYTIDVPVVPSKTAIENSKRMYMSGCATTPEYEAYCSCTYDKLIETRGLDGVELMADKYTKNKYSIYEDEAAVAIMESCANKL